MRASALQNQVVQGAGARERRRLVSVSCVQVSVSRTHAHGMRRSRDRQIGSRGQGARLFRTTPCCTKGSKASRRSHKVALQDRLITPRVQRVKTSRFRRVELHGTAQHSNSVSRRRGLKCFARADGTVVGAYNTAEWIGGGLVEYDGSEGAGRCQHACSFGCAARVLERATGNNHFIAVLLHCDKN